MSPSAIVCQSSGRLVVVRYSRLGLLLFRLLLGSFDRDLEVPLLRRVSRRDASLYSLPINLKSPITREDHVPTQAQSSTIRLNSVESRSHRAESVDQVPKPPFDRFSHRCRSSVESDPAIAYLSMSSPWHSRGPAFEIGMSTLPTCTQPTSRDHSGCMDRGPLCTTSRPTAMKKRLKIWRSWR